MLSVWRKVPESDAGSVPKDRTAKWPHLGGRHRCQGRPLDAHPPPWLSSLPPAASNPLCPHKLPTDPPIDAIIQERQGPDWLLCTTRACSDQPGTEEEVIHRRAGCKHNHLWWSLCTLYLHACQVRVTVGDSGLCCTCVTYFERRLTPLSVDYARSLRVLVYKTQLETKE